MLECQRCTRCVAPMGWVGGHPGVADGGFGWWARSGVSAPGMNLPDNARSLAKWVLTVMRFRKHSFAKMLKGEITMIWKFMNRCRVQSGVSFKAILSLLFLAFIAVMSLQADSGRGRHAQLYVVPTTSSTASGQTGEVSIDTEHCGVWHGDKRQTLEVPDMLFSLGSSTSIESHRRDWSAGQVIGESTEAETFRYRIAFTRPVTVGSVLASSDEVARLKPDAPYLGDPANPDHWESIQVGKGTRPRLATYDTAIATHALLLTERRRRGRSSLGPVRVFGERYFNPAPLAGSRARSIYDAPDTFGGQSYPAIGVARGQGSWISAGRNRDGLILAPPISDVHPQWIVFAWDETRQLDGLYLRDNFVDFVFERYVGPNDVTPLAGTESEWRRIREDTYRVTERQGRWIQFDEPLETRGLRVRITRADLGRDGTGQVARMDAFVAFEALGQEPAPVVRFDAAPLRFGCLTKLLGKVM